MFEIQLSNPKFSFDDIEISNDINLEELIQEIFPLDTEYAFIIWNNIFIPLSYKYDVSLMVLDFIKIRNFIKDNTSKSLDIHWASNTFRSEWHIMITEEADYEYIVINAKWYQTHGRLENLLNDYNSIKIGLNIFGEELEKIINFVENIVKQVHPMGI